MLSYINQRVELNRFFQLVNEGILKTFCTQTKEDKKRQIKEDWRSTDYVSYLIVNIIFII